MGQDVSHREEKGRTSTASLRPCHASSLSLHHCSHPHPPRTPQPRPPVGVLPPPRNQCWTDVSDPHDVKQPGSDDCETLMRCFLATESLQFLGTKAVEVVPRHLVFPTPTSVSSLFIKGVCVPVPNRLCPGCWAVKAGSNTVLTDDRKPLQRSNRKSCGWTSVSPPPRDVTVMKKMTRGSRSHLLPTQRTPSSPRPGSAPPRGGGGRLGWSAAQRHPPAAPNPG